MNPTPTSNTKIYWTVIILIVLVAAGGLYFLYQYSQKGTTSAGYAPGDTFAGQTQATTAEQDLSADVLSGANYDLKAGLSK